MPNLRILSKNAVDDYLSLSATSESGALVATNLSKDMKSKVWRGVSLAETITLTWANAQLISMVALPFCNFSSTSTIRVKLYTNVADGSPVLDTGAVLSNQYTAFDKMGWGNAPQGVNSFYYGGGTYASIFFASQSVKKIEIILDDSSNQNATYLEASRLVVGDYWSPLVNADYGISIEIVDKSNQYRNESGDLLSNRGISYKKISMKLSNMDSTDRTNFIEKLQSNGKHQSFYMSLFPESLDNEEEQTHQIYGKLSASDAVSRAGFNRSTGGVVIDEI